ncbi:MAG: dihydroorotase family protein [Candidatus Bathyarchaeia archaeon]
MDLNLINAKIPNDKGFVEAGISIDAARICKIAKPPNLPRASRTIDVEGNIALPGLIDAHVHLRDLELSYKEDFFTGTCAAAAGGFTTVLDMPNTRPPTNTPERLRDKIQRAKDQIMVNVGFYAAFPGEYSQFSEMVQNGAIAFKVYLYHPVTELDVYRDDALLGAFERAKGLDRVVAVHAEEGDVIQRMEEGFLKSGKTSLNHFLRAHSVNREVNAVKRVLNLAKRVDLGLHISHVSAARSIDLLKGFKPNVTCEATPHHLLLTASDLHAQGGKALTNPPLRSRFNTSKLWRALNDGTIDIVASDHAPHSLEEKRGENVWKVSPGIPGLETTLPLLLNEVNRGRMVWNRLIQVLATRPAEIFRLNRGSIQVGGAADLVIVDMNREYKIDSSKFHSKAKHSPFDGWKVKGKPIKTFVKGQLVMEEGEIVAKPGIGQIMGVRK